jgi:cobalt-zinc-cadmium efflux system protein
MGAGHDHGGGPAGMHARRLGIVLVSTVAVMAAQAVGAWVSGSLALLADTGHALSDVAGLLLALVAVRLAARAATNRHSFGLLRLEVLAAMANAVILFVVAALVTVEAVRRWDDPPHVEAGPMMLFAAVGLVVNVVGLVLLREGARESINVRAAYLEVLGDMLGSVGVLVAGVVLAATGWSLVDPLASLVVAALIVPRAWVLLRHVVQVLLEAVPDDVDLDLVREHITRNPGVVSVHDLHVWTLTSGSPVMSAHVVVTDEVLADAGAEGVLDALGECLSEHFDVAHSTFQIENVAHGPHEAALHA